MGIDHEWDMDNFTWLPMASHRTAFWRSIVRRASSGPQVHQTSTVSSVPTLLPTSSDWESSTPNPVVPLHTVYQQSNISNYVAVTLATQELGLNMMEDDPPPYQEVVSDRTPQLPTTVPNSSLDT